MATDRRRCALLRRLRISPLLRGYRSRSYCGGCGSRRCFRGCRSRRRPLRLRPRLSAMLANAVELSTTTIGMEGNSLGAPSIDHSSESEEFKMICRLSTILVATIEEVKDRVSQIEFIFCDQLFPGFQSTLKCSQKTLSDSRKASEDEWKKKECSLLQEIKELRIERQRFQEEIQQLCCSQEESKTRLMRAEELVKQHELEKQQLMNRLDSLMRNEKIISDLKVQLEQKSCELSEANTLQERLLEQGELSDRKLLIEQAKNRRLIKEFEVFKARFKKLKSQYVFLSRKIGDQSENQQQLDPKQCVDNSPTSHPRKGSFQDFEEDEEEITNIASQTDEQEIGSRSHKNTVNHKDLNVAKRLIDDPHNIQSSCSQSILQMHNVNSKSESLACVKKANSCWRDTRAQETRGGDPHDDFLDTPLDIVRNLNKLPCEDAQNTAVPPPEDIDFNNSDDETQDMNAKTVPLQQRISIVCPENKGFKYVEPVRKRAERDNLKGVECLQCKKFYDAVLPGGDSDPNLMNRRCEHHDGVSRHRYRHAPPMTPEGFWNIGFDSDM